jgi:hypothetical protein
MIFWTVGLVLAVGILAGVGGGLAGHFLDQKKNQSAAEASGSSVALESSTSGPKPTPSRDATAELTSSSITTTEQTSPTSAANDIGITTVYELPPTEVNWRHCGNCRAMFFDGYVTSGVCPIGGGHFAQGYMFNLPHDYPPPDGTQDQWRFCKKCYLLFYHGNNQIQGVCEAGGGHLVDGYVFVLQHDTLSTLTTQDQWRRYKKCDVLFYDGASDKGLCAAGGAHVADGFNFVLPHDLTT